MSVSHVAVIGAGLIGAATAYFLTSKGARVTVLEKGAIAGGATGRSFGWINANFAETPDYFALRVAGIEAYQRLPASITSAADLQWKGSLWWEEEGDALTQHSTYLSSLGYDHKVLGSPEIHTMVPSLQTVPQNAIWANTEASVDTAALTHALLDAACAQGAIVWDGCAATGMRKTASNKITGLRTDRGDIECEHVILTAGVATQTLLTCLNVSLPMENKPGILVETTPCPPLISELLLTPKIHFRQGANGRFLMGQIFSGDAGGTHPDQIANQMLGYLKRTLAGAQDAQIARILLGTRPVPQDGFPAVGKIKGVDGLYVATSHSGITLGPLLGEIIANEVLDGGDDPRLAGYRPDRFSKQ